MSLATCSLASARTRRGSEGLTPRFTRTRWEAALAAPAARAAAAAASAWYVPSPCSAARDARATASAPSDAISSGTAAAASSFCSSLKSFRGSPSLPLSASRRAVSASSQADASMRASAVARSPMEVAWATTPAASSHEAREQLATIATSRAANATVIAAAVPLPGASPSAESRSRKASSRRSR